MMWRRLLAVGVFFYYLKKNFFFRLLNPWFMPMILTVSGVLANSLLLYCIRRHTQTSLGAYKQLLTLFASVDIVLCVLHLVVEPVLLIIFVP